MCFSCILPQRNTQNWNINLIETCDRGISIGMSSIRSLQSLFNLAVETQALDVCCVVRSHTRAPAKPDSARFYCARSQ